MTRLARILGRHVAAELDTLRQELHHTRVQLADARQANTLNAAAHRAAEADVARLAGEITRLTAQLDQTTARNHTLAAEVVASATELQVARTALHRGQDLISGLDDPAVAELRRATVALDTVDRLADVPFGHEQACAQVRAVVARWRAGTDPITGRPWRERIEGDT